MIATGPFLLSSGETKIVALAYVGGSTLTELQDNAANAAAIYSALPSVSIDMIPDNPPVVVPAGGSFTFTGILTNNTDQVQTTDVGVFVNVPGYGLYGPLLYYLGIPLSPYQTISIPGITQSVPGFAPLGTYDYVAYCGDYPTTPIDYASFEFTVVAPIAGNADNWDLEGWFNDKAEAIPSEFML